MKLPDNVVKHFMNPQNVGQIAQPEGIASVVNPVCGDITDLYFRIKDGVIQDAKFKSFGCAVTIASASVLTEKIRGKDISELLSGTDDEVINQTVQLVESELGELPPPKLHCPPATVQAFFEALLGYYEKRGETETTSRIRRLIPLLATYYERQRKTEDSD